MNVTSVEFLRSWSAWIWQASWQGTLLVAVVLIIQWTGRKVLSARWQNTLWLLVLARLLLPALPAARFSAFNWLPPQPSVAWGPVTPSLAPRDRESAAHVGHPTSDAKTENAEPPKGASPAIATKSRVIVPWLAMLWLLGFLAITVHTIVAYLRLRRNVERLRVPIPESLRSQFRAVKDELGSRRVEIVVSEATTTPFVTGLWKARVVLPKGLDQKLSPEEMRMILLHELGHVRRGDLWMAWLSWLATTVHWFNPFIRWALARARRDREMACDEWVLAFVADARAYGAALVRFLELNPTPARAAEFGTVGIFESNSALVQRVRQIANYRPPRLFASVAGFAILSGVGLVTLTNASDPKPLLESITAARTEPPQRLTAEDYEKTLRDLRAAADKESWNRVRDAERKFAREGVIYLSIPPPDFSEVRLTKPSYQFNLEDRANLTDRWVDKRLLPSLYGAIDVGDPTIVRQLLQDGAKPNLPANDESYLYSPMDLAIRLLALNPNDKKRREVVNTLLAFGADPNPKRTTIFPVVPSPDEASHTVRERPSTPPKP